jgi:hypothetical protein
MKSESCAEETDTELARVAGELREIAHGSSWARTLAIGEIVLKHFFGGRVDEWRTRRRQKETSIRRLAQRPDCPLGKSALSEAVAVYVARKELPAFVEELTPSHVGLVLRLPPLLRVDLLQKALVGSWSLRAMRNEVISLKRRKGERRGRPRFSGARVALSQATRSLDYLRKAVELLVDARSVDEATVSSLDLTLSDLKQVLAEALSSLRALASTDGSSSLRGIAKASLVVPKQATTRTG